MPTHLLTVNGKKHTISATDTTPLIAVLRDELGLIGTRYGCGAEQCGACRILINQQPAYACTTTVAAAVDQRLETIECDDALLTSLKAEFLNLNAGQCGYCLSGILMSALAYLRTTKDVSRHSIQMALRDHLCRCGSHNRIIAAIEKVATTRHAKTL